MKHKKLLSVITAAAVAAVPMLAAGCGDDSGPDATPENTYEYDIPQDYCRTYYELFVRSFSDGNGDGIGDFRGLINNLDYLNDGNDKTTEDLGINGIWLMPINKSSSYHKYDVVDYYDVDPEYGTLDDFDDLVKECDKRNIWLQMDLVLNHTSSNNQWFKDAIAAANAGEDPKDAQSAMSRYIFERRLKSEGAPGGKYLRATSDRKPVIIDGEEYVYYYYANFSDTMPDLNLDSPAVRTEIENIVEFWLSRGIRSFRLDAVPSAYGDSNVPSYSAENGAFWKWFNDMCHEKGREVYGEKYPDLDVYCYNVGEVLTSSDVNSIKSYMATGMSCFSFNYSATSSGVGYAAVAKGEAYGSGLTSTIATMQSDVLGSDPNAILSNLMTNHDQDRAAGYCKNEPETIKTAAALYLLSPGNPYIYYGEEIGANGRKKVSNTDANRRLSFNWGDSSRGIADNPPGVDYNDGQPHGTWASQTEDYYSILTYYRNAIMLRNRFPEIGRGVMTPYVVDRNNKLVPRSTVGNATPASLNALNKPVAVYKLTWKDRDAVIVHNVGSDSISLDLSELPGYDSVGSLKANGGDVTVTGGKLDMSGKTVAVLKKAAE